MKAPLSDSLIFAVARLVDDAQSGTRYPSHSEIDYLVGQVELTTGDPKASGQLVGKMKRVRHILGWAFEFSPANGERFVALLISNLRANGGFRKTSQNFVGIDAIEAARHAFAEEGFDLTSEGALQPRVLDSLSGKQLTEALKQYVQRARKGAEDAALMTGTGKDLLEATAAHVLIEINGTYSTTQNFATLLGQAFIAIGLVTSVHPVQVGEPPQKKLERALYDAACAVNALRNKQGTGHGRPWLPSVSDSEARAAIEIMGTVAARLLDALP